MMRTGGAFSRKEIKAGTDALLTAPAGDQVAAGRTRPDTRGLLAGVRLQARRAAHQQGLIAGGEARPGGSLDRCLAGPVNPAERSSPLFRRDEPMRTRSRCLSP